jgi:hypothetical protein
VGLAEDDLALRVAVAVAEEPGGKYNPLYVHGTAAQSRVALTAAMANRMRELDPSVRVGYVGAEEFSRELIEGLERNHIEAWRARYRTIHALFLADVDRLAGTERSQEELFHLFDELNREGVQLVFTAAIPPQALELQARLRSRLESGLVVEVEAGQKAAPETNAAESAPAGDGTPAEPETEPGPAADAGEDGADVEAGPRSAAGPAQAEADAGTGPEEMEVEEVDDATERGGMGDWYLSREKAVLIWPYTQDWLIEGLE